MTTRITLIDRALVRIGADPLGSESAPGAETHIATYQDVIEDLLTRHPWHFNTQVRQLNRLQAQPDQHWAYAYELPTEMLGSPRAVYDRPECRRPFTDYELFEERQLRTNAEAIWLKFQKATSPVYWPGYFRSLVVLNLMAELALAVREDAVLRDRLRQDCFGPPQMQGHGGKLAEARALNDMASPSPVLSEGENPLIDARR